MSRVAGTEPVEASATEARRLQQPADRLGGTLDDHLNRHATRAALTHVTVEA